MPSYAFPTTAGGTLVLVAGMIICSCVVERSTTEETYNLRTGEFYILWLQKGEPVNDQVFHSYAIFAKGRRGHITTSRRNVPSSGAEDDKAPVAMSRTRQNVAVYSRFWASARAIFTSAEFWTSFGALVSLCGFVAQFVGLRGMHWSASVGQLGATLLMTILRSVVRRGLAERPDAKRLPEGYEIDWLATRIVHHEKLLWREASTSWSSHQLLAEKNGVSAFWTQDCLQWGILTGESIKGYPALSQRSVSGPWNRAHLVMQARKQLGETTLWPGPASDEATSVAAAIETVMDILFTPKDMAGQFIWTMNASNNQEIQFKVKRQDHGKWIANVAEIEAALSLWLFSTRNQEKETITTIGKDGDEGVWLKMELASGKKGLRLLGPNTKSFRRDMKWWIGEEMTTVFGVEQSTAVTEAPPSMDEIEIHSHRVVGFGGQKLNDPDPTSTLRRFKTHPIPDGISSLTPNHQPSAPTLAILSNLPLKTLFAQDMFSAFMWAVARRYSRPIDDQVTVHNADAFHGGDRTARQSLTLQSPTISKIVQGVHKTGLGTLSEVLMSILPPLSVEKVLPDAGAVVELAQDQAREFESTGNWDKAADIHLWAFRTCITDDVHDIVSIKATADLTEFCRSMHLAEALRSEQRHPKALDLERLRKELVLELKRYGDEQVLSQLAMMYRCQGKVEGSLDLELSQNELGRGRSSLLSSLIEGGDADARNILGWTALHDAASKGDDTEVLRLLDGGEKVNSRDIAEWTPLHYAAWNPKQSADVCESLLENGANVDTQGRDGTAPLHCAVRKGHLQIAELLIRYGANVEMRDSSKMTPLHWASYLGNLELVDLILYNGASCEVLDDCGRKPVHLAVSGGYKGVLTKLLNLGVDMRAKDKEGKTLLHHAVDRSREVILKELLKWNIDKETKDRKRRTALHQAIIQGHELMVETLLTADADSDARDQKGRTGLHLAVKSGMVAMAGTLLKAGSDKAAIDNQGQTILHCAADNGKDTMARILVAEGVEVGAKDHNGSTALHLAASKGYLDVVTALLDLGASRESTDNERKLAWERAIENGKFEVFETLTSYETDPEATNTLRHTAIALAANSGHRDTVERLIELTGNESHRPTISQTVLNLAIELDFAAAARMLLELGAGAEVVDNDGSTPLHRAAQRGHEAVLVALLSKGAGTQTRDGASMTALHVAAYWGREAVVRTLLGKGASKEAKDNSGMTALHLAAENGHNMVVKALVEGGVSKESVNSKGWTALHYATVKGHVAVIKTLLEANVDNTAKTFKGLTALHLAAEYGRVDVVRVFLDSKLKKEAKDKNGRTALHIAAEHGRDEVVNILLGAKVNKDARSSKEWTALHRAAVKGHDTVVGILVQAGANMRARDDDRKTALHLAVENRRDPVVGRLLVAGVQIEARDRHRCTALHYAATGGDLAVVQMLLGSGAKKDAEDGDGNTPLDRAIVGGHNSVIAILERL